MRVFPRTSKHSLAAVMRKAAVNCPLLQEWFGLSIYIKIRVKYRPIKIQFYFIYLCHKRKYNFDLVPN